MVAEGQSQAPSTRMPGVGQTRGRGKAEQQQQQQLVAVLEVVLMCRRWVEWRSEQGGAHRPQSFALCRH
jgi:hypothetical protein